MENRIAFIINPISGAKDKTKLPKLIEQIAQKLGASIEIRYTECSGHAAELTRELCSEGFNRIVAVGGDGTINEVAKVLVGTNVELGIVPQGSGNGLARHLRIPMTPRKSIEVAISHRSEAIDTAYINQTAFFCTAGVGFDALIGNRFAESKSRGLKTYATIATKEFLSYKPKKYKLDIDGENVECKAFLITIANASQYGNNAYIAPQADLQDGILDVVIVNKLPLLLGPLFAMRLFLKKIERSRFVKCYRGRNITIVREGRDYIHYDGEPGTMDSKLELSITPRSLRVVF